MEQKYIVNPKTNKIVLLNGKIGKQIVASSTVKQLENLFHETARREIARKDAVVCGFGELFSVSNGEKCVPRKSPKGKKVAECYKTNVRNVMSNYLANLEPNIKSTKQAVAVGLAKSLKDC
jgi:hypothetical protein